MEHLEEKRAWLSMEEVLEELDEPMMPGSDDDLDYLQMDEKERDEDRSAFLHLDTDSPDTFITFIHTFIHIDQRDWSPIPSPLTPFLHP